jgi:phospholipid/cholesterol/gamma-HCH transport system substrate-binding protein
MTQRSHALATGLFLVVLGTGILVAFFWLRGSAHGGREYMLITRRSASGLYVGAPVTEHGLAVGRVVGLRLRGYPPTVVVRIRVARKIRVGAGTKAIVVSPLFGGGATLALVPPTHGPYRPLPERAGEPPLVPLEGSASGQLMRNLATSARELKILGARLDRALGPRTLRRFSTLTKESVRTSRHLARLTAEADRELPLLVTRVNSLIGESQRLTRRLAGEARTLHRGTRRLETTLLLRTLPETSRTLRALDRAARAWSRFGAVLDRDPQILLYGRRFAAPKAARSRPHRRGGPHR